jgi:hypothetical protein
MTTEENYSQTAVAATIEITADMLWKGITFGGTIAASPLQAVGIIRSTAKIGQGVGAVYDGITKVKAGATVTTVGYPLTLTTSGFVIAATSGSPSIGRAMSAAASGDLLKALVDFKTLPFWSNA